INSSLPYDIHRAHDAWLRPAQSVNGPLPDDVRVVDDPASADHLVRLNILRRDPLIEPLALRYQAPALGEGQNLEMLLVQRESSNSNIDLIQHLSDWHSGPAGGNLLVRHLCALAENLLKCAVELRICRRSLT